MKQILLGLITLLSSLALMAQDEYIPYVRDCEFGYYEYNGREVEGFYHYWIEGEFEFNGNLYKGLYQDISYPYWDPPYNNYYVPKELLYYVREDNRKVYVWYKDKEYLWYDFTLEVGDVLRLEEGLFGLGKDLTTPIKVTGEMTIGGKSRKYIDLDVGEYRSWVEGLGDWNCLPGMYPFDYFPDCYCGWKMFYVKENGEFVFRETLHNLPEYGYPDFNVSINDPHLEGTGGIKETQEKELQIVTQGEQWIVTLPNGNYRMIEVVDTTGRVAWCAYINGDDESVIISTTDLARGVYIVVLTTQRGDRITCKVVL